MIEINKTVRKIRSNDYWCIGEHESWFSDMANEGLHLKKMGLIFTHFIKGEAKKTRYRMDVSQSRDITLEQKQDYSKKGWDYVTRHGEFNVFSSPVELNAPELYTNPVKQSNSLKNLEKKFIGNTIVMVLSTILISSMLFVSWFSSTSPSLALIEGRVTQQAVLIIIALYSSYNSIHFTAYIRCLRKKLLEGKPINHSAPWKNRRRISITISCIYILLLIPGVILPFMEIAKSKTYTLPTTSINLPIVRLSDVEQNPELVREPSYNSNNIDWGNRYSYDWSIFAPLQYESDEQGVIPNKMWKDGSGTYSPSIYTRVYKLKTSNMSEWVLSGMIEKYSIEHEGENLVEINHRNFDKIIVHEGNVFKEVFAYKGKGIVYVRYFGHADIDSIIDAISDQIDQITSEL